VETTEVRLRVDHNRRSPLCRAVVGVVVFVEAHLASVEAQQAFELLSVLILLVL
jgi:hypothetical protein